jgi:hypothetical protein
MPKPTFYLDPQHGRYTLRFGPEWTPQDLAAAVTVKPCSDPGKPTHAEDRMQAVRHAESHAGFETSIAFEFRHNLGTSTFFWRRGPFGPEWQEVPVDWVPEEAK